MTPAKETKKRTAPTLRTLVFALFVLGLGLGQTIHGNERDFIFVNTTVSILAFGSVLLAFGLLLPTLIERVAPRRISPSPRGRGAVATVVLLALVFGALSVNDAYELASGEQLPG